MRKRQLARVNRNFNGTLAGGKTVLLSVVELARWSWLQPVCWAGVMTFRNLKIREARGSDAESIRGLFRAAYGDHYCDPRVYDLKLLKKFIFSDGTLVLVAEDRVSHKLLGTASVIFEVGAYSDLVGEFGKLVVHPSARHRGLGDLLLRARVQKVCRHLHVGLIECRTALVYSQRLAEREGFAAVGFLPSKLLFREREDAALFVRYFENSLELRRNHPRVVPEVYAVASVALKNAGLRSDLIVDEEARAYPFEPNFQVEELTSRRFPALLRIERGRLQKREIFGPMRLHYGVPRLVASRSRYLVARDEVGIAGAIGFMVDEEEKTVRVFELISLDDRVIRFLVGEMETFCRTKLDAVFFEIDVSAHAPRLQRTLLEMGFSPGAFIPAFSFHKVERIDVVKMIKLAIPLEPFVPLQTPSVDRLCEIVCRYLRDSNVSERVSGILRRIRLYDGLTAEQLRRFVSFFSIRSFPAGDLVFAEEDPAESLYVVLEGRVEVDLSGRRVGNVGEGECLGEVAFLSDSPHFATARAAERVRAAVLTRDDLMRLIRSRPDIGTVIYRNLALGLCRKLRRVDRDLIGKNETEARVTVPPEF